jgi:hypothetical protein
MAARSGLSASLAGGTGQPAGLDKRMAVAHLRSLRGADHDKGQAERELDDHDASVGLLVGLKDDAAHGIPGGRDGMGNELDFNIKNGTIRSSARCRWALAHAISARLQKIVGELIKRISDLYAENDERRDHQIEAEMHGGFEPNALLRPTRRDRPETELNTRG